jgi:hypothetical protein
MVYALENERPKGSVGTDIVIVGSFEDVNVMLLPNVLLMFSYWLSA